MNTNSHQKDHKQNAGMNKTIAAEKQAKATGDQKEYPPVCRRECLILTTKD